MKYDLRQNYKWRPGGGCAVWVLSNLSLHYPAIITLQLRSIITTRSLIVPSHGLLDPDFTCEYYKGLHVHHTQRRITSLNSPTVALSYLYKQWHATSLYMTVAQFEDDAVRRYIAVYQWFPGTHGRVAAWLSLTWLVGCYGNRLRSRIPPLPCQAAAAAQCGLERLSSAGIRNSVMAFKRPQHCTYKKSVGASIRSIVRCD